MVSNGKGFQRAAHVVMILLCVFCLFPFVLLISSSITDEMTLIREGYSVIPKVVSFDAYKYLFVSSKAIARGYKITVFVTVIGTLVNLTFTTILAYPLSRKDLPHRSFFSFFVFFTMLFTGAWCRPI